MHLPFYLLFPRSAASKTLHAWLDDHPVAHSWQNIWSGKLVTWLKCFLSSSRRFWAMTHSHVQKSLITLNILCASQLLFNPSRNS
jgi:hypothetical protein